MSEQPLPWHSERELDANMVQTLLAEQFPQLAPVRVQYLHEGWDSQVFEVNGNWVFRFPKRADVAQVVAVEIALLPLLAERLPVPIPSFRFLGKPDALFPFLFMGYQKIPGLAARDVSLDDTGKERVAAQLGQFFSALHSFPLAEAQRLGVPGPHVRRNMQVMRKKVLEKLPEVRPVLSDSHAERLQTFFEAESNVPAPAPGPPCLVHHDLYSEHILIDPDEQRLTGIIDWSDVSLGDPAVDLAGIIYWQGEPFLNVVLQHYTGPVDPKLVERARFFGCYLAFFALWYGVVAADQREIEEGLQGLMRLIGTIKTANAFPV
jgi:aminoglycoside phosphotransferase (APT) family kinase protein